MKQLITIPKKQVKKFRLMICSFLIAFTSLSYSMNKIEKYDSISTYVDQAVFQKEQILKQTSKKENNSFDLFSHGRSGELLLNGKWMNAKEVASFLNSELKIKKANFSNLNIYGCEFAKGNKGQQAVAYLENTLCLKVNASTNITGKNGDWILEVGNIEMNQFKSYSYNLQLDNTHYIPPFYSPNYTSNDNSANYLYLSTPSVTPITVTVTDGSGTLFGSGSDGVAGSYIISKSNPYRIDFGTNTSGPLLLNTASVGSILANKGLVLNSTSGFYVNQKGGGSQQSYSLTSKGTSAVGKHFKWANSHANGADPKTTKPSGDFISIYAIEDATITVSDYADGVTFDGDVDSNNIDLNDGSNEGQTLINLLAGESIMVRANTSTSAVNRDELIGANIFSTGNIAINAGSNFLSWATKRDFGIDQIVPIELVGSEYVVIAGANASNEKVTVTATQDNTAIYVNGSATEIATINEGDYYDISGANFTANDNMYFTTNKPVYVYHSLYGASAPNTVGSNFIPSFTCFTPSTVDEISNIFKIGTTTFTGSALIVTTQTGAVLSINGTTISSATYEKPVTGTADYVTYKIPYAVVSPLASANNTYTVTSTKALAIGVFGGNTYAGFGGYFSGFGDAPVISNSNGQPFCDVANLEVPEGSWDTYTWYKDDVEQTSITGNTYPNAGAGVYKVIVGASGGDCEFISEPITVYNTPNIISSLFEYCDENADFSTATLGSLDLGGVDFDAEAIVYDSEIGGTSIPNSTLLSDRVTYGVAKTFYAEYPSLSDNSCALNRYPFVITFCGVDTDGDGVINAVDLDDDNDGVKDIDEDCGGFISQNFDGNWVGTTSSIINVTLSAGFAADLPSNVFSNGQVGYYINYGRGSEPRVGNTGTGEYKVEFSSGIPASEIAFYVRDYDYTNSPTGYFDVKINGGTPAAGTFELVDDINYSPTRPVMNYDQSTSQLVQVGNLQNQNIMIRGVGETLITELIITANNLGTGDWIGYSLLGRSLCDKDNDGVPNSLDIDSDNDGIVDNVEAWDTLAYIAPGTVDSNGNGVLDIYEGVSLVDTDGDTTHDYIDEDSDNDGTPDIIENGGANTVSGIDTDGDGLDDVFDTVSANWDSNDGLDNNTVTTSDLISVYGDFDSDAINGAPMSSDLDFRDLDSSATGVSSSSDGGLESNNRLSEKIARRGYLRTKLPNIKRNQAKGRFVRGTNQTQNSTSRNSWWNDIKLEDLIPEDVIPNSETYIFSPTDLIAITNATEIFSVDVFENNQRVGAVLATETQEKVYEHAKYICDRVQNDKLLDVNSYALSASHSYIVSTIEKRNGAIEYATQLSLRRNGDNIAVETHWNLADYPVGNRYLNFQIWSSSMGNLETLLNEIINLAEGYAPVNIFNFGLEPRVFVQEANFDNDNVEMIVHNKNLLSNSQFVGVKTATETENSSDLNYHVTFNNELIETINLNIGQVYDFSSTVHTNDNLPGLDVIYMADGAWGLDVDKDLTSITNYNVLTSSVTESNSDDVFNVLRNVSVSGQTSAPVTLFRAFNPAFRGIDLDNMNGLTFKASGSGTLEVALLKETVQDFGDQMKFTLQIDDTNGTYFISKEDFQVEYPNLDWSDLRMMTFKLFSSTNALDFSISSVQFLEQSSLSIEELDTEKSSMLTVYPNPNGGDMFLEITSSVSEDYTISIFNILGQNVYSKRVTVKAGTSKIPVQLVNVQSGIYLMKTESESGKKYNSKVIIE